MLDVANIDLFYGASHALRKVSLSAETGKVTAVLGRNGVGKTSLMRAVVGQHPIADGNITWEGKNISRDPAWRRSASGIAIVPQGRDMLGRRGGDLSGGQQQQLAIGRALVTRPRLLVLDEPTEGIQPSIIKDIQRVIKQLADRGDMAILLVEQYFDFAHELADEIVVLERGEVVLAGSKDALDREKVRSYLTV